VATGRTVGVMGARGGVGASCLAAALAAESARTRPTALVDLDLGGGGLDVLLGIENESGLRWPDLGAARGQVASDDVMPLLPTWERASVLSADHRRPGLPAAEVVVDVVRGLRGGAAPVVVDLPRVAATRDGQLLDLCDVVVLLVPCDVPGVAGAHAILGGPLRDAAAAWLVAASSTGRLAPVEVADALDRPLSAVLRTDRSAADAVERGLGPLVARRQRLRRVAAELWRGVEELAGGGSGLASIASVPQPGSAGWSR
jgi:secretion/DNA translocation related CpaE-like protein